jgi:hypothetical protein
LSATTSGALKVLIESLGLGLSAYRDEAPAGTKRPYITILEEITLVPDQLEDGGVGNAGRETVQIDLWQNWHDPATGVVAENYGLAPALKRGIHGQRLQSIGSSIVYEALVRHSVRFLEPTENLVHHALTVEVFRQL